MGLLVISHFTPGWNNSMPGGAGMAAPPSALEPRGMLWAEGAPAGPVLARGTRKNRGRGGREERKRLRAALPPLIPATRPALIQDLVFLYLRVASAPRCAVELAPRTPT